MNAPLTAKTDLILKHAQPAIRDELSRHLSACGFTDPDDPALNALVVQAMVAGQPVRLVERGGAALATESGLARLGDRVENSAWSVARLRVGTVVLACLLSAGLGAVSAALAFKFWGVSVAAASDLAPAGDSRLTILAGIGATLHVERKQDTTYVYFDGPLQPAADKTREGLNFLYFRP